MEEPFCSLKETPKIIAVSETKLKENNLYNITLEGYTFLGSNSKTSAGGVGLYVDKQLDFVQRKGLEIILEGVESCWIEIENKKSKNVAIGCINRHPNNDCNLFYELLRNTLVTLNNKGHEVVLIGNINIKFLQYNANNITSEYLDMILEMGFMPLITKPTRITDHTATLIDHIYTNVPEKVINAGIFTADITDHLPVFCTIANKNCLK